MKWIFLFLLSFPLISHSQEVIADSPPSICDTVYTVVDKQPEFNGDVFSYLVKNFNIPARFDSYFPAIHAEFVIDKNGNVRDARIVKEIKECPECEKEALRVINSMPAWKPGMLNGFPVCVKYKIPIKICTK